MPAIALERSGSSPSLAGAAVPWWLGVAKDGEKDGRPRCQELMSQLSRSPGSSSFPT